MAFDPTAAADRREALWRSLSELFVARELQDYDYRAIAQAVQASGFPLGEVERILGDEVAPAFQANLNPLNTAPEFEGWADDVVRTRVAETQRSATSVVGRLLSTLRRDPMHSPILQRRWQEVLKLVG